MRSVLRTVAAVLATVVLAGCSLDNLWNEQPEREPDPPAVTAEPETAEPDERTVHPYAAKADDAARCVTATKEQLAELQDAGGVGQAITYPRGAMVRANAKWWTVAVATEVHKNSEGYTRANVDSVHYYVTNSPSYSVDDVGVQIFVWPITTNSADTAQAMAAGCLKKVPVPKPTLDPNDPATYNGRVAGNANCVRVSKKMLAHLQDVGQVGGAITYAKGAMVRANRKWWTVAVTTEVHQNSAGHTRENVPLYSYFVTNDPSFTSSKNVVYFPIKVSKSDTAQAMARRCVAE